MSIKKVYKVDDLHCPSCANEIIERLEKIEYIDEVHIDYDAKEMTIIGQKLLSNEQVDKVINEIISSNHNHRNDRSCMSFQSIYEIVWRITTPNFYCIIIRT